MASLKQNLSILSLQYHCYPDEVGGAWGLTYEVNKRLVAKGHKVFQVTCKSSDNPPSQEVIDGIAYHRISQRASKSLPSLWLAMRKQIKTILRSGPLHIIHIHNPLMGFVALLQPKLWKVPKVYHFHSSWFDEERINRAGANLSTISLALKVRLQCIRIMEWTCYKFSRTVLFLSEYSKKRFNEYYSLSKPRQVIIAGGVDLKAFHPIEPGESTDDIREGLGLEKNMPLILTVRRLEERMGLINLIWAVDILVKKDMNFQLVVVGKGSLRQKMEELIIEKNLQNFIQLTGLVPREALPLYFRVADLFVLPTTAIEGFGLVTAEAFASGLPVMGTPVGATPEILALVDPSLILKGTSPESLAQGMENFLLNPETYRSLKAKCRETAEARYSWDIVTGFIEEEFKNSSTLFNSLH